MILKLGMKHQAIQLYKVCINHDPWMTLTYFTARSTQVAAHAFEWRKLLKYDLKVKTCSKMANGLNFYDLKKILTPGDILTLPRVIYVYITILVKQVYQYISQVSDERLQEHWSSGHVLGVI